MHTQIYLIGQSKFSANNSVHLLIDVNKQIVLILYTLHVFISLFGIQCLLLLLQIELYTIIG
jgi:hypothetical protein